MNVAPGRPLRLLLAIIHFGETAQTVALARCIAEMQTTVGIRVVIVANDGAARPSNLPPAIRWVQPEANLGYGAGAQRAFDCYGADADVFGVLNNDISLTRGVILSCASRVASGADIVGPVMLFPDGRYQSGPGRLSRTLKRTVVDDDPGHASVECEWVTGAAMFLSREVATLVRFDGSYFLGCEDVDLCIRARRAGHTVVCDGGSRVTHERSTSIGDRWAYYGTRNRLWLVRKNYGWPSRVVATLDTCWLTIRHVISVVVRRQPNHLVSWFRRGLLDGLRRYPDASEGPWPNEPVIGSRE